ncbi:SDR family NAD(P)-dependent oxidoreductase [Chitinasiproducens palmae]|uniref:3-hydroxy acid dehydrogenase / malonic semialdehyde reductase n=1 Tax=Chitinasiproducens palmae TaxID=1770053 RepID=A0A1H2PJ02_9BURK|nr:SDR family NAD(P)-dependent oxidoreductase [Chitinasiproducens palmae]SDV46308.1 3-hydroxy acid dehydrogenase / malonic semialdehyde reductase [Chitinasiproducens palmae]
MNILVTGATAGFGEAIAKYLLQAGHTVIATGRRADRLDALATQHKGLHTHVLDVSDRASVAATFDWAEQTVGPIDVLVNNAGLALGLEPGDRADLDDWETMIDTNVKGLVYCTRRALPGMVERNHGWVINLGSTAGTYPYPGGNVYGATKAFVHQFSVGLRSDLAGKNVHVASIEPGLGGGTEFSNTRFKGDDAKAAKVYEGTQPLQAEDIAATVGWLLSLPEHVNVNAIELMPTCQAPGPLVVVRNG